ncbi:MAG: HlyD family efflux transporter periplasmic adaptor subunit [Lachnospiraceae bacterium]|nr:HlyD family efflux transporter periplasmic adaptor subunit [Lachnospiraceae bacterium]
MSKQNEVPTTDENLVEMHRQAKKKKRNRLILTIVIVVVVVIAAGTAAIIFLRNRVSESVSGSDSEVLSAEVTTGSISTTVSGSGTLANEDEESIDVPSSLEIVDYYVEEGDTVSEGDLIATVTNASLLTALSDAQDALDELDEELEDAASDEVSSTITSSVSGRVKYIAVSAGDDVATVMYDSGSLMLLSLDGYMAVDISTDSLTANDSVTVTVSSGTTYSGTVESVSDGTATVLITDNGTTYGDMVTVSTNSGTEVGSGELYIHSQMAITGYAGTVSAVSVSENESVSSGTTLLTLTDTETSANYDAILKEREETEEQLETLIRIYKEGGICATASGTISSLNSSSSSGSSGSDVQASSTSATDSTYTAGTLAGAATDSTYTVSTLTSSSSAGSSSSTDSSSSSSGTTTVATISLDENMIISISVDESDILSLSEGQEAAVTIDSIGEDSYTGTVTSISTSASSDSGVTSYGAEVTIPKMDDMLAGMSASVVITIEGVDDALLIPVDALHQTSATAYVYTEYDESSGEYSGMVEVTTGLSNSSYVEITDGLSEGDVVYYTESSEDDSSGYNMDFGNMGDMDFSDMGNSGNSGGSDSGSMPGGGGSMPGGN